MANAAFIGGFGVGMERRADQRLKERSLGQDLLSRSASQVNALSDNIASIIENSPDRESVPRESLTALTRTAQDMIGELAELPGGAQMAKMLGANLAAKLQGARTQAEKTQGDVQNKVGAAVALVEAARGQPEEVQRLIGTLPKEQRTEFERALDRAVSEGLVQEEEADQLRVQRIRRQAEGAERDPNTRERIFAKIAEGGVGSLTPQEREALDVITMSDPFLRSMLIDNPGMFRGMFNSGQATRTPAQPVAPPPAQQPTTPQNPAPVGATPPTPQPQQPPPPAMSADQGQPGDVIPPAAIDFLRQNAGNPEVVRQFDEKYGVGAAQRVLSGG